MSFKKSMLVTLGATAGMLMAQGATFSESFETGTTAGGDLAATLSSWSGYGTFSNTTSQALSAGVPIAGTHNIHVQVDGSVEANLGLDSGDAQLDMLVRVAKPDEELSSMSDAEAKFAMAIDSDGTLKYWTGAAWAALGTTVYSEDQWIRVAVVYDNTGKRCKVSVNGNACITAGGYKAASGNDTNGPWYPVLQNSMTAISSLKVVGTTALDDVNVTQVASSSYEPTYNDPSTGNPITVAKTGSAGSVDVPLAWLDKNNVPADATDAADGSGMKVADKYALGLDPNNGSKFEMTDMTMAKADNTVTATITVPACTPPSGSIKIQKSASNSSGWTDGATLAPGATSAQLTLESGNVTYFRMVLDK